VIQLHRYATGDKVTFTHTGPRGGSKRVIAEVMAVAGYGRVTLWLRNGQTIDMYADEISYA